MVRVNICKSRSLPVQVSILDQPMVFTCSDGIATAACLVMQKKKKLKHKDVYTLSLNWESLFNNWTIFFCINHFQTIWNLKCFSVITSVILLEETLIVK